MNNNFAALILFSVGIAFTITAHSDEITNSEKYQWLEQSTPEQQRWILNSNAEVNLAIKKSENKPKFEKAFRTLLAPSQVRSQVQLATKMLKLVRQGLGKGTDLILAKEDQTEEVLFSDRQLARNGSYTFVNVVPSGNAQYLALIFARHGSTDNYHIRIFDLEKRSLVGNTFEANDTSPYWNPNNFLFLRNSDGSCQKLTPPEFLATTESCEIAYNILPGWRLDTMSTTLTRVSDGATVKLAGLPTQIIASKNYVYYTSSAVAGNQIYRFSLLGSPVNEVFYQGTNENFHGSMSFGEEKIVVPLTWGGQQKLKIIDEKSKSILNEIPLPEYANYIGSVLAGEQFVVAFQSLAKPMQVINFDLKTQKFDEQALKELLLLTETKQEVLSYVVQVKSLDGTQIPVRITHLKILTMNKNNPVYFHVYGGFGISDFTPTYQQNLEVFLKHGGVLVSAAVRGGNEFGVAWQKAAQFENKPKTLEDVAAVGKYLSETGYTNPNKLVLAGGSNGGMVVAATAQKFQGVFGLVVAANGVQDMLRRNILDANMDKGWSSEYGDLTDEKVRKYTKEFSPVEIAKLGPGANFLIVNGRQDSRVNPAHSFKLKAALKRYNLKGKKFVYLVSLNNAGHAVESPAYQDYIGWRTQVVEWTIIYDYLGIAF